VPSDLAVLLRLQQFADSALPIGGSAHSFGLESLVEAGFLDASNIERFLRDYLEQAGVVDAAYCRRSCEMADAVNGWLGLNLEFGARKMARESREGSAAMGRRFLSLAARVSEIEILSEAVRAGAEVHLACCFGFVAGAMGLYAETAAAAYLQQSITGLLSCCQRLLPLGQTEAHRILWSVKGAVVEAVHRGAVAAVAELECFTPLLEIASARHPGLHTRLFMS
jgi:urease accessory protein